MEEPWSLAGRAKELQSQYDQSGNMEDLEQAISLHRSALAVCPSGDPNRPDCLTGLATVLWSRCSQLGNIEDLEEAISLDREALSLHALGHADRSVSLSNLATDLSTRYKQLGKMDDLEECIALNRDALALRLPGHPNRSSSLDNLAIALRIRYEQLGKMDDLEECIALNRDALALRLPGHPDRSMSLNNLANALRTQYEQLGKMDDLEECIALNRDALALHLPGHPNRSASLNNLAIALSTRYEQLGKINDLEECIALNRGALALLLPGHPYRSASLNNLAIALSTRYEQLGKINDLEECIALNRDALALRLPGHPNRSSSLDNLAIALRIRYGQLGKMDDLEECIALNRDALALRLPGHPDRSASLNNLAADLSTRFRQSGKMDDLEECIALNRDALALYLPGHPDHSTSLDNLASALSTRYGQLGKMEDLEECIALNRDALALCLPGHLNHSASLNNLAVALRTQFHQLRKMEDLEECIALNRDALALRLPGHPDHSMSLNNLANALCTRYEQLGKMDDLEECIALNRDALALRLPGHPDHSMSLNNLANALCTRYEQLGKMDDLEECIALNRDALALRLPGHPDRSLYLHNLAATLTTCSHVAGEVHNLGEAFTLYQQAASDSTSYLRLRFEAAVNWSKIAQQYHHQSTLNAYTIALDLLQQSLIYHSDVEEQHRFLAAAKIHSSVASDAASAAIQSGNLELAVQFLEQGRAILWSRIDAYRSPLEELCKAQGGEELADQLKTLSTELEHLVLSSNRSASPQEKSTTGQLSFDARVRQHRILSQKWDTLVETIRKIPGFTHFLRIPPFEHLRLSAAEGPVILINISEYRSDAIILTIQNPPILVPLPDIELSELGEQTHRLDSNRGIITVLRYLWDRIVFPVVTRLTDLGVEKQSRIWWCPTGELCALPLHAAGPFRRGEPGLPDIYTSSYISTLTSLIRARSPIVQVHRVPKLLVVGQPDKTLQKVADEVGIISQSESVTVDLLLGDEASHEAVLDGLKEHSWVHFACHGHLGEDSKPFQASFELHNGRRLTLLELIQARLPNAESAFLAACHTAAGDSRTRDENLHLSAALQFCGFRSVVGTLWEMYDDDGPMISNEFYGYMLRNPDKIDFRDSAYALSSAIRAMRKAKLPPERWVMFVHIGA